MVELSLGLLLFSLIGYATVSLLTGASSAMTRVLGEHHSRSQVLTVHREMAEGGVGYAGYLAASRVSFETGADGQRVFVIEFPDYETSEIRKVQYIWHPDREVLEQQVDDGERQTLLQGVAAFAVCKREERNTLRISIAHRVAGLREPIVRTTEGRPRNLDEDSLNLEECS